jgi:DNA ligase-1
MDKIMQPMLAAKAGALSLLRYPVLCTPKLDGIRCLTLEPNYGGRVIPSASTKSLGVSWFLKLIVNVWILSKLYQECPPGLDGELMTGETVDGKWIPDTFNNVSSKVMSNDGFPEFRYVVFDYGHNYVIQPPFPNPPYWKRLRMLEEMELPDFCVKLMPIMANNAEELVAYEAACLLDGYEGCMIRTPDSPYKLGRSTLKEQWLLKIKRYLDAEAVVIDIYEKMHNANPAERSATGALERSTHQANMVPTGVLGGVTVRDIRTNVSFNIGSGFDDAERARLWKEGKQLIGRTLTYRYQPHGVYEKPRFPIFVGWRALGDLP